MVGFRVRVNQDRVVTIGLERDHVVSLIINSSDQGERQPEMPGRHLGISASGLQIRGDSQDSLSWFDRDLKIGDTISIEVADVSSVDTPTPSGPESAEALEWYERKQLEDLLKKYGPP